jgi:hypothetical protein
MGVPQGMIDRMNPKQLKKMLEQRQAQAANGGVGGFWAGVNNYWLQGQQFLHSAHQTFLGIANDFGWGVQDQMDAMKDAESKRLEKAQKETERAEKEADRAEARLQREIERNRMADAVELKNQGLGMLLDSALNGYGGRGGDGRGGRRRGLSHDEQLRWDRKNGFAEDEGDRIKRKLKEAEDKLLQASADLDEPFFSPEDDERKRRTFNTRKRIYDIWAGKLQEHEPGAWLPNEWPRGDGLDRPWRPEDTKPNRNLADPKDVTVTEQQGDKMIAALEKIASQPTTTIQFVDANLI